MYNAVWKFCPKIFSLPWDWHGWFLATCGWLWVAFHLRNAPRGPRIDFHSITSLWIKEFLAQTIGLNDRSHSLEHMPHGFMTVKRFRDSFLHPRTSLLESPYKMQNHGISALFHTFCHIRANKTTANGRKSFISHCRTLFKLFPHCFPILIRLCQHLKLIISCNFRPKNALIRSCEMLHGSIFTPSYLCE